MKTTITLTCENESCSAFNVPIDLSDSDELIDGIPKDWTKNWIRIRVPHCEVCHHRAKLLMKHGDKEFTNPDHLGEYLLGAKKEIELTRRLVAANAATEEEKSKVLEIEHLLKDARCPCCGNAI